MLRIRLATLAAALAAALALAGCSSGPRATRTTPAAQPSSSVTSPVPVPPTRTGQVSPSPTRPHPVAGLPRFDHVVIVVEENRAYGDVIGTSGAPFLNSLASGGASFTRSYAITHPSQPNYLALFSGSTQGLSDDSCPHTYAGPDLAGELIAAGGTFAGYSEDLPSPGYSGCSAGSYARKHNPWSDFTDVPATANQPFTAFPADYARLPDVSFVMPNLEHDMHDGTVALADRWLEAHLGGYARWAKTHDSLLIVTWDEDDSGSGNHIPTIFAGAHVRAGQYGERVDQYRVLRTVEDLFGLPHAGASANVAPISDVWSR